MSRITLAFKDRPFLIMHLHAIKYHSFDCLGVLVGRKEQSEVIVEEAVPLFHQRVMSGTCEIAFDMISSVFLKPGQHIVGLYEAALPASLAGGKEHSALAQYLGE